MAIQLERECQQAVVQLRAALIDLYDSIGADPSSPRQVARELSVGKTLTWNIARVIQEPDEFAAVPHIPGSVSIEKILKATQKRGAPAPKIESVRAAIRRFEQMITEHAGDRATLDLVIDGIGAGDAIGLEQSRKHLFLGASGVFGVQAKTRLLAGMLAPNKNDPDKIDIVNVSGTIGLRRLRGDVRTAVHRSRHWTDQEQRHALSEWNRQPLHADDPDHVMHRFNRGDLPEIERVQVQDGFDYVIQPGPTGNQGAFDFFTGNAIRGKVDRYWSAQDQTGEMGATISVPTEQIVFDLIVDRELDFALDCKAFVRTQYAMNGEMLPGFQESSPLPIRIAASRLAGSPPAVATPLVPRYAELTRYIFDTMEWDPARFVGTRLELKYPPLGSTVTMRFDLPKR